MSPSPDMPLEIAFEVKRQERFDEFLADMREFIAGNPQHGSAIGFAFGKLLEALADTTEVPQELRKQRLGALAAARKAVDSFIEDTTHRRVIYASGEHDGQLKDALQLGAVLEAVLDTDQ